MESGTDAILDKVEKRLSNRRTTAERKNEADVFVFLHVNYVSTVSCNLSLKLFG